MNACLQSEVNACGNYGNRVKEKILKLSVLKVKYDELAFYVKSLIGIAICDMISCNDEKFCVTFLTPCIIFTLYTEMAMHLLRLGSIKRLTKFFAVVKLVRCVFVF